jgi:hypothetical protein
MEITYELIALYGINEKAMLESQTELDQLFTESYVEEQEVMDIAKKHQVVVLYETTESTGYSEVFLINNIGEMEDMVTYSLDVVDRKREQIKQTSLNDVFHEDILEQIRIHMAEHDITEHVFLVEYLDELLLDNYEAKKEQLRTAIQTFFVRQ